MVIDNMKYIFLDIDGTLFDHNTFGIPKSAYKAVEMAQEAGHKVFICTGRSCCMLNHVEQISYEGVIAAAGAYVEAQGKVLYEECIGDMELQQVLSCCRNLNVSYILEGNRGIYMHSAIGDYFRHGEGSRQDSHNFFKQKMVHGMEEYDPRRERIYKFCIYAPKMETLQEVERRITDKYHFIYAQVDERHPANAEVTLARNNKASGIKRLLDYYGGSLEDTFAVGDSLNDLEMLQECGTGIAMGNADERLKPYADYITTDIDKDGIYKAFEHYGLLR